MIIQIDLDVNVTITGVSEVDDAKQMVRIGVSVNLEWVDLDLKWDPKSFGNLDTIQVKGYPVILSSLCKSLCNSRTKP